MVGCLKLISRPPTHLLIHEGVPARRYTPGVSQYCGKVGPQDHGRLCMYARLWCMEDMKLCKLQELEFVSG